MIFREILQHNPRNCNEARKAGLAITAADGYVAAIAATNGFAVATRDTTPFEAAGVEFVNPWQ